MNSRTSKKPVLYFLLLIIPTLACQTLLGGGQPPPVAMPTAESPLPVSSDIYLVDDFSDPNSGWLVGSGDGYEAGYSNGGYYIFLALPGTIFASASSYATTVRDVSVRVDGQQISEPKETFYGVTCRFVDLNNFYMLRISDDGYYSIARYVNNEFAMLGSDEWQYSDVILQNGQVNHIQGDCSGSSLRLYVNGTLLMETNDSSLSEGVYGVIAGTIGEEKQLGVNFFNFVAMVP